MHTCAYNIHTYIYIYIHTYIHMNPGFDLIPYNDLAALDKQLGSNPNYCAFMVEPIQVPLNPEPKP
jgi:acetylornithine/succinyldiaminopimelate/putrescine aminotransferase